LVLMVTLVAFESLSVATILPVVGRQLGDLRLYGWVFSAFLLASLVGIAVAGSVADRFALAWPMTAGLVLFAIGLAIGGSAPTMPVLVAGRVVQGLGAGVVPAVAYVAIGRDYPPACRPRMFAVLSTAWVVPGLVGPAVAALVATTLGWRWVFLGLLPLVGAALVLAATNLRGSTRDPRRADPFNFAAVAGILVGAGVVLVSLSSGSLGWAVGGMVVGGVVLARSLRPLTPPHTLIAGRGLPATVLNRGLLTFCFFAGDAYVPYALTTVRHAGTEVGALALSASTVMWTVGAWVQERRIHRWGPRRLVRSGEVVILAGLGLMTVVLWPAIPPAAGIGAWSLAGLGMGFAYSPLSVTALDRSPRGGEGRTTAALQLTDVLGQALGTGAAGAAVASGVHGLGARPGVALAFGLAGAVAFIAWLVGARLPPKLIVATPEGGSDLMSLPAPPAGA